MKSYRVLLWILASWSICLYAAQDAATAVEGTVKKIDGAAKTITVETADGTTHVFKVAGRTAVHGTEDAAKDGPKDSFRGLKEGSHVVVHYTLKGAEETPREVDVLGAGTLKVTEGTVGGIDRAAKTITVKTAEGTEETFRLTADAAADSGKDIGKADEKAAHVTVYYTQETGRKIAHFFKKIG